MKCIHDESMMAAREAQEPKPVSSAYVRPKVDKSPVVEKIKTRANEIPWTKKATLGTTNQKKQKDDPISVDNKKMKIYPASKIREIGIQMSSPKQLECPDGLAEYLNHHSICVKHRDVLIPTPSTQSAKSSKGAEAVKKTDHIHENKSQNGKERNKNSQQLESSTKPRTGGGKWDSGITNQAAKIQQMRQEDFELERQKHRMMNNVASEKNQIEKQERGADFHAETDELMATLQRENGQVISSSSTTATSTTELQVGTAESAPEDWFFGLNMSPPGITPSEIAPNSTVASTKSRGSRLGMYLVPEIDAPAPIAGPGANDVVGPTKADPPSGLAPSSMAKANKSSSLLGAVLGLKAGVKSGNSSIDGATPDSSGIEVLPSTPSIPLMIPSSNTHHHDHHVPANASLPPKKDKKINVMDMFAKAAKQAGSEGSAKGSAVDLPEDIVSFDKSIPFEQLNKQTVKSTNVDVMTKLGLCDTKEGAKDENTSVSGVRDASPVTSASAFASPLIKGTTPSRTSKSSAALTRLMRGNTSSKALFPSSGKASSVSTNVPVACAGRASPGSGPLTASTAPSIGTATGNPSRGQSPSGPPANSNGQGVSKMSPHNGPPAVSVSAASPSPSTVSYASKTIQQSASKPDSPVDVSNGKHSVPPVLPSTIASSTNTSVPSADKTSGSIRPSASPTSGTAGGAGVKLRSLNFNVGMLSKK